MTERLPMIGEHILFSQRWARNPYGEAKDEDGGADLGEWALIYQGCQSGTLHGKVI